MTAWISSDAAQSTRPTAGVSRGGPLTTRVSILRSGSGPAYAAETAGSDLPAGRASGGRSRISARSAPNGDSRSLPIALVLCQ